MEMLAMAAKTKKSGAAAAKKSGPAQPPGGTATARVKSDIAEMLQVIKIGLKRESADVLDPLIRGPLTAMAEEASQKLAEKRWRQEADTEG